MYAALKSFAVEAMHKIPSGRLKSKYNIDELTDFTTLISKDNLQEFLDEILTVREQLTRRSTKETSLGRS